MPTLSPDGTFFKVPCPAGTTVITLDLNPQVRWEFGWGSGAVPAQDAVVYSKLQITTSVQFRDFKMMPNILMPVGGKEVSNPE